MKKNFFIEALLILTVLVFSFMSIHLLQEKKLLIETVVIHEKKQKALNKRVEELKNEKECLLGNLADASEAKRKVQKVDSITGVDSDLNTKFNDLITKLFEANLNFTPENFADKKKEVASYLTKELNNEYFGKERNTYQDVNETSSMLEKIEIYHKMMNDEQIEGLIIVYYKSKRSGHEWTEGMNIFKINYKSDVNKVSEISNLGSTFFDIG